MLQGKKTAPSQQAESSRRSAGFFSVTNTMLFAISCAIAAAAPLAPTQWQAYINSTYHGRQSGKSEGIYYFSDSLQAKRVDKAGYAPVITLFTAPKPHGPGKGMMMAVVNGVCAEWCPTESTYLNMIKVGDGTHSTSKSTDLGPATVHGQGVEKWSWGLGPGGIPLEKFTISLSAKAGNFTPVELQIDSSLERFHEISDFSEFSGAPLDPSVFAVSGMDTCKESPKCSSDAAKTFLSGFSKPELEIEME